MELHRLDKILAQQSTHSRTDVKKLIKKGLVVVNGQVCKQSDMKINIEEDIVKVQGEQVVLKEHVYIMMNKPTGVVSATEDGRFPTVVDILPEHLMRKGLFPAGRLDKDTVGFMLITDDGAFAHSILSPRRHVSKTYLVGLDKPVEESLAKEFSTGVVIGEDNCKPAQLNFINTEDRSVVEVILTEGLYHQIKRMFAKYGYEVVYLKRTAIGKLPLDESIPEGQARELTPQELLQIQQRD